MANLQEVEVNELERERLILAWIALHEVEQDSADHKRNFWAFDKIWDLSRKNPQLCWEIILEILGHDIGDRVLSNLAAGPLEDLLVKHGPAFIDRVEAQAREDERFRTLLGGVWQNEMSDEVWQRLLAVSGERW